MSTQKPILDLLGKPTGAFSVESITDLFAVVPQHGVGLELGAGRGNFSKLFLENTPATSKLVSIDDWLKNRKSRVLSTVEEDTEEAEYVPETREEDQNYFVSMLAECGFSERVIILDGDFLKMESTVPHDSCNFVWVDGDMEDEFFNPRWFSRYWMKLLNGGIIGGSGWDKLLYPKSRYEVLSFAHSRGLAVNLVEGDSNVWWIRK